MNMRGTTPDREIMVDVASPRASHTDADESNARNNTTQQDPAHLLQYDEKYPNASHFQQQEQAFDLRQKKIKVLSEDLRRKKTSSPMLIQQESSIQKRRRVEELEGLQKEEQVITASSESEQGESGGPSKQLVVKGRTTGDAPRHRSQMDIISSPTSKEGGGYRRQHLVVPAG